MALHLVKRDDLAESYIVRSGSMRAGVISRVQGAGGEGYYVWSITGWYTAPSELGVSFGNADSLEAAKEAFAGRWRKWLAWAGLEEAEAEAEAEAPSLRSSYE